MSRTLANVLLDLRVNSEAQKKLDQQFQRVKGDHGQEDEISDRLSDLDAVRDVLHKEFREVFLASTGVSWESVESAIQDDGL